MSGCSGIGSECSSSDEPEYDEVLDLTKFPRTFQPGALAPEESGNPELIFNPQIDKVLYIRRKDVLQLSDNNWQKLMTLEEDTATFGFTTLNIPKSYDHLKC